MEACPVMITPSTSGLSARNAVKTSRPFRSGICRSSTARSNNSREAAASAAPPLSAIVTSHPASSSTNDQISARPTLSSTTSTFGRAGGVVAGGATSTAAVACIAAATLSTVGRAIDSERPCGYTAPDAIPLHAASSLPGRVWRNTLRHPPARRPRVATRPTGANRLGALPTGQSGGWTMETPPPAACLRDERQWPPLPPWPAPGSSAGWGTRPGLPGR